MPVTSATAWFPECGEESLGAFVAASASRFRADIWPPYRARRTVQDHRHDAATRPFVGRSARARPPVLPRRVAARRYRQDTGGGLVARSVPDLVEIVRTGGRNSVLRTI